MKKPSKATAEQMIKLMTAEFIRTHCHDRHPDQTYNDVIGLMGAMVALIGRMSSNPEATCRRITRNWRRLRKQTKADHVVPCITVTEAQFNELLGTDMPGSN